MESFLSHSADKFGRGTNLLCCVSESFWQRECFEKEVEGVSKFQSIVFCLTAPKMLVGGTTLLCYVSENFWHRKSFGKEGGVSGVSVESFLSQSVDKFGRGTTLLCCISEKVWQRKSFEKEGEGVSKVSVEGFLSHRAKIFGRRTTIHFCAVFQRNSGSEKV